MMNTPTFVKSSFNVFIEARNEDLMPETYNLKIKAINLKEATEKLLKIVDEAEISDLKNFNISKIERG